MYIKSIANSIHPIPPFVTCSRRCKSIEANETVKQRRGDPSAPSFLQSLAPGAHWFLKEIGFGMSVVQTRKRPMPEDLAAAFRPAARDLGVGDGAEHRRLAETGQEILRAPPERSKPVLFADLRAAAGDFRDLRAALRG